MTASNDSQYCSDTEQNETGATPPGSPWYRRPIISLVIALFVAILLGLAIFVLADQTSEHGGTTQTPTSPTTSANSLAR